jgi:hypothetical protein
VIYIVNKYHMPTKPEDLPQAKIATAIYCGRGSFLGNPFVLRHPKDRDWVCDQYAAWMPEMVSKRDNAQSRGMYNQLLKIQEASIIGDVMLVCYCAPKRCHCETIKSYIEEKM